MIKIGENKWLTDNQWKVYMYVCNYIDKHNFSPTLLEVAKHMDFRYRSQAQIVIDRLCHYGLLTKNKNFTIRNLEKIDPVSWQKKIKELNVFLVR